MSLYQCSKCGCVENTATSDGGFLIKYMINKTKHPEINKSYKEAMGLKEDDEFGEYCCVCNPMQFNKEGNYQLFDMNVKKEWHNKFPRTFLEKGKWKTNREGNLEHIKTGETDFHKYAIRSKK